MAEEIQDNDDSSTMWEEEEDEAHDEVAEGPLPTFARKDSGSSGVRARHSQGSQTQDGSKKLSLVSQAYDRGNKGYLDKTEKKLRAIDTKNQGYLDVNKVYALMQELQSQQQKSLTLKWAVIALSGFAILLCLANIGT